VGRVHFFFSPVPLAVPTDVRTPARFLPPLLRHLCSPFSDVHFHPPYRVKVIERSFPPMPGHEQFWCGVPLFFFLARALPLGAGVLTERWQIAPFFFPSPQPLGIPPNASSPRTGSLLFSSNFFSLRIERMTLPLNRLQKPRPVPVPSPVCSPPCPFLSLS